MSIEIDEIDKFLKIMDFKQLTDIELTTLLSQKEEDAKSAFTEIYTRYSKKVYIYCKKAVPNQNFADDIYQDTFVKFYNAGREGKQIDNLNAYLFRIARNLVLNFKRDNQQEFVDLEDFHLVSNSNQTQEKELAHLINEAMELLIEEHREAFIMQAYQDMSYNEIAEALEVPMTTIRNRIVRAKRKLKEILSPYLESRKV